MINSFSTDKRSAAASRFPKSTSSDRDEGGLRITTSEQSLYRKSTAESAETTSPLYCNEARSASSLILIPGSQQMLQTQPSGSGECRTSVIKKAETGSASSSPTLSPSHVALAILHPELRHHSGPGALHSLSPTTFTSKISASKHTTLRTMTDRVLKPRLGRGLCHQACTMPEKDYYGYDDWSCCDNQWRPRISSMPSTIRPPKLAELRNRRRAVKQLDAQQKLRSFVITSRGRVQERSTRHLLSPAGACLRASSDNSVSISRTTGAYENEISRSDTGTTLEEQHQQQDAGNVFTNDVTSIYRVQFMGAPYVGKRAIIREFINCDITDCYESSFGDEENDHRITILLDGEKSTLEFMDKPSNNADDGDGVPEAEDDDEADAYVVVYSVEDRLSLDTAADILYELRERLGGHTPVILVANKTDLVRTRVISEPEGKQMAANYDCKYIEVSAAIDHKVDDLLVGILKQIRLVKQRHLHDQQRQAASFSSPSHTASPPFRRRRAETLGEQDAVHCCPITGKHSVLRRLFGVYFTSKSCDNLYVL